MSNLSSRIATLTATSTATLCQLYATIGLSSSDQTLVLGQLEEKISLCLREAIEEAEFSIASLQKTIEEARQNATHLCQQLKIDDIDPTLVKGESDKPLQEVKSQVMSRLTTLTDQQQLHQSALFGDLSQLQGLYARLAMPKEEINAEFMEQINAQSADLSSKRMARTQTELTRVQAILASRNEQIASLIKAMTNTWKQLAYAKENITQADIDVIISGIDAQKSVEPTLAVIASIESRKAELDAEVAKRTEEIATKKQIIATLHKKISAPAEVIAKFDKTVSSYGSSLAPAVLNFYTAEVVSLEAQKQAKMQSMIFELRTQIDAVYKELHMSASEMAAFKAFQSSDYNDALLDEHEAELASAQSRLASLSTVFKEHAKWIAMKEEVAAFELSSADPNRFNQRGAHLILKNEERMRKRRDVTLPALEAKFLEIVADWEKEHSDVVKINGQPLADQLRGVITARDESKNAKKKGGIDNKAPVSATPAKARPTSAAASASTPAATPARPQTASAAAAATPSAAAATPARVASFVAATPAKKEAKPVAVAATPLATIPASPVAPTVAATPIAAAPSQIPSVRATPMSKIPSFSTSSFALPSVTPTATPARAVLGEVRSTAVNAPVAAIPVESEKPVVKAAPAAVESMGAISGSYLADFQLRLSCCNSDSDKLLMFTQAINSTPQPSALILSKLHLQRSMLYESMEEDNLAEEDLTLSKKFSEKFKDEQMALQKQQEQIEIEENNENSIVI